jgi:chitin synthase
MKLHYQKYLIILLLLSINLTTIITFIYNADKWYVYLFILALASFVNAWSVILLLGYKMFFKKNDIIHRTNPLNYTYIVPCYNESEEELTKSFESLITQHAVHGDKRTMIIICDGKVIGSGNTMSTDKILKKILKQVDLPTFFEYTTWDNKKNKVEVLSGCYNYKHYKLDYILLIKNHNYGKRDSIVLARKLCYNYNMKIISDNMIGHEYMYHIGFILSNYYNSAKIDYMIGIDADTIFEYNCSYELIKMIETDKMIHGCVGFVDIVPSMNWFSPFVLYQYAEYIFAQCLRRQAQSSITNKVSCLSGCNQILRVSEETCGSKILERFNYLPRESENIFNHIRSYASEDRNHVCLMLSMYPYVKTVQTLHAISYTIVPTSIKVFMSQRRRWSLGASMNDLLLVYLPGVNIFERISALVNISTYILSPFIFVATIYFIRSIIENPTYLMLLLSIPIIIIFIYSLMIPIFIKQISFRRALYYYLSYIIFVIFGSFISLLVYFNSILNMDIIRWGKTRTIAKNNVQKSKYSIYTDEAIQHFTEDELIRINKDIDLPELEYDDTEYDQNQTSIPIDAKEIYKPELRNKESIITLLRNTLDRFSSSIV